MRLFLDALARGVPLLAALAAPAATTAQTASGDSVVYALAPTSRFDVKTGKAGLFGFAGHDHLIRARAPVGRVVYYPSDPAASRIDITVLVDSLEVLTPSDTSEVRQVTEAMRSEVLQAERYPEIRFVALSAVPAPGGFRVQGGLTIAGATRDISVEVATDIGPDTLRARGSFEVKQSDFGITPYRGGPAGTVRVADRVKFEFDAVALRAR